MKINVICLDVGVLLTKDDEEFECYSQVYDHKYGYYDEDQIPYKEKDLKKAIEYAREYVADGVDMTYAVITNQGQVNYYYGLDDGNIEDFTYDAKDVIFSIAKINGKIREGFIKEEHK